MDALTYALWTHSNDSARLCFRQVPLMHTAMVFHHRGVQSAERSQESLEPGFSAGTIEFRDSYEKLTHDRQHMSKSISLMVQL